MWLPETIDNLVRLESFIRNGFINKQHVVSVFFDLEKAYDTTWKYGILSDLHNMGFRGRMPHLQLSVPGFTPRLTSNICLPRFLGISSYHF